MKMNITCPDGSWFVGDRKWWFPWRETRGTHHYIVLYGSAEFKELIGCKVAVPIDATKYFVLNWED